MRGSFRWGGGGGGGGGDGVGCDAYDHVITLELPLFGLTGKLPNEIGCLPYLESLILENNSMVTLLPANICSLDNLSNLILNRAFIVGPLPDCICDMPSLAQFHMSGNFMNSPLPECMGNNSALDSFRADCSYLQGEVPTAMYASGHLEELYVRCNFDLTCPPENEWSPNTMVLCGTEDCDEECSDVDPIGCSPVIDIAGCGTTSPSTPRPLRSYCAWRHPGKVVHAARPISAGDELCVTYIDHTLPTKDRQALLQKEYHLTCKCPACTMDTQAMSARDIECTHYQEGRVSLVDCVSQKYNEMALHHALECLSLVEGVFQADPLLMCAALTDAIQAAALVQNGPLVMYLMQLAYQNCVHGYGQDSEVTEYAMESIQDPHSNPEIKALAGMAGPCLGLAPSTPSMAPVGERPPLTLPDTLRPEWTMGGMGEGKAKKKGKRMTRPNRLPQKADERERLRQQEVAAKRAVQEAKRVAAEGRRNNEEARLAAAEAKRVSEAKGKASAKARLAAKRARREAKERKKTAGKA
ncbi:hypothetical protein KIPB_000147 [Kipferlia bialata]|uniref:SET domain-containing protein n=1 Tax=Kipferlia bialata TaxID=797122 RepID=A0A9K3GE51_9EUKA|nr:hypothetical protein KIPB_000147 [Kipferlia bialata]|eukprot:g147.t1